MTSIRADLPFGWATFDPRAIVRTGDQLFPKEIRVNVTGKRADAPRITLTLTTRPGDRPRCTAVVFDASSTGEVHAADLRAVKISEWTEAAIAAVTSLVVIDDPGLPVVTTPSDRPVRGGSRRDLGHLRNVAEIYNNAPVGVKPSHAVRDAWSNTPYRTVARWIQHAKLEGFIPGEGN